MTRAQSANAGPSDEDARWIVIDGRRWRRTDPVLADEVVASLTSHLGRARSAVRQARRSGDATALSEARARVDAAKRGLGERGPAWWDEPETARQERAREALIRLDDEDHPRGGTGG